MLYVKPTKTYVTIFITMYRNDIQNKLTEYSNENYYNIKQKNQLYSHFF